MRAFLSSLGPSKNRLSELVFHARHGHTGIRIAAVSNNAFRSRGGSTCKASTAAAALITPLATELRAPAHEAHPSTGPLGCVARAA